MKTGKSKFLKLVSLAIVVSSVASLTVTNAYATENGDIPAKPNPFALYEQDYYATGDINMDGNVDIMDIGHMRNFFLKSENVDSEIADINSDGSINILDFVSLKSIILCNASFITLGEEVSRPNMIVRSHQIPLNTEKNMTFEAYDEVSGKFSYYIFIDDAEGGVRANYKDESVTRQGNYLSLGNMSGKDVYSNDIEKVDNLNMPITAYEYIIIPTFMEHGWNMGATKVLEKWRVGTYDGIDCYFNTKDTWYKKDSTVSIPDVDSLLVREVDVFEKTGKYLFSYSSVYFNSEEYETNKKFNFAAGMMPSETADKLGKIDLRAVQHSIDGLIGFNLD